LAIRGTGRATKASTICPTITGALRPLALVSGLSVALADRYIGAISAVGWALAAVIFAEGYRR
jgi:hypothetical protein